MWEFPQDVELHDSNGTDNSKHWEAAWKLGTMKEHSICTQKPQVQILASHLTSLSIILLIYRVKEKRIADNSQ